MQDFEDFEDDYIDTDIAYKRGGALEVIFSGKAIMMYITFGLIMFIFLKTGRVRIIII